MHFAVLGGACEIGGNRILLKSKRGDYIFLDYGRNFVREEEFFQRPFMSPTFEEDYLKTKLITQVSGIEVEALKGVLVSHAHQDHWGYLNLLPQGLNAFVGSAAERIINAYLELGYADEPKPEFSTFRTGDSLEAGDFHITPVHVDHSVPGSYGFIIECDGKKIVYTGDLRMHGPRRDMTMEFIDRASSEEPDLLLTEATKVAPENDPEASLIRLLESRMLYRWGLNPPKRIGFELRSEEEVSERIRALNEGSESIILVEISSSDADRIRSVWKASEKLGRTLVMDERVAFLNETLSEVGIEGLPRLGSYLVWRRKRRGREGGEVKFGERERRSIRDFLERVEDKLGEEGLLWGERRRDLLRRSSEFLVLTSNATRFLYEIPMNVEAKIEFILSRSEPFSEESALSMDRLMNWLTLHGVRRYYRIHVSGHIAPDQMSELIDSINPSLVVPIHTEHPDLFDAFLPRRMRSRILIPEAGELIEI